MAENVAICVTECRADREPPVPWGNAFALWDTSETRTIIPRAAIFAANARSTRTAEATKSASKQAKVCAAVLTLAANSSVGRTRCAFQATIVRRASAKGASAATRRTSASAASLRSEATCRRNAKETRTAGWERCAWSALTASETASTRVSTSAADLTRSVNWTPIQTHPATAKSLTSGIRCHRHARNRRFPIALEMRTAIKSPHVNRTLSESSNASRSAANTNVPSIRFALHQTTKENANACPGTLEIRRIATAVSWNGETSAHQRPNAVNPKGVKSSVRRECASVDPRVKMWCVGRKRFA